MVLECEADGNPIKPNMVKWMRGDTIAQGSMLQSQKRAILSVNASHENSGAYKCVVDNGIGEVLYNSRNTSSLDYLSIKANDSTALLLVRHSPRIIDLPSIRRTAGPPGGKAHMFCQVEAVPTAEFSWVIEGEGKVD